MSQRMLKQLERRQHGGLTSLKSATTLGKATSGMISSISFTPVQGIELITNPSSEDASNGKSSTYFSTKSHFTKVSHTPAPR